MEEFNIKEYESNDVDYIALCKMRHILYDHTGKDGEKTERLSRDTCRDCNRDCSFYMLGDRIVTIINRKISSIKQADRLLLFNIFLFLFLSGVVVLMMILPILIQYIMALIFGGLMLSQSLRLVRFIILSVKIRRTKKYANDKPRKTKKK